MNRPVELVGASDRSVNLSAGELSADVRLDPPTRSKVTQSFAAAASPTGATEPDRIFLAIENIRGVQDSALVEVYVSAPQHGNRPPSAARLAGTISGFGLTKATRTGPGNGLSQTFDISEIIDELHLQGGLDDLQHLDVKFIPLKPLHPAGGVSVGAVKVFRQPQ
jgi:tyrosinase